MSATRSNPLDSALAEARAMHAAGNSAQAVERLNGLMLQHPAAVECYTLLGGILRDCGKPGAAATVFRRALARHGESAPLHAGLASVLVSLQRFRDAVAHYSRASELAPDSADIHLRLANTLFVHGDFDLALQHYRTARKLAPELREPLIGEANILMFQGETQAARSLIEPLTAPYRCDPTTAALYAELCQQDATMHKADRLLASLLTRTDLTTMDQARLRFARGRLLDRQGEYPAAFRELQQGNRLKERPGVFQQELRRIQATLDVFTDAFFRQAPRSTRTSARPIFIVGMPRSGTSLVERIIASHSRAIAGGELLLMNEISARLNDRNPRIPYPYAARHVTPELLNNMADFYLNETSRPEGGDRLVTDKMPHNFLHLGLVALLFPSARIVHCMRDPRDTCLSCFMQDFGEAHAYSYGLESLATYYTRYMELMQHWKHVLPLPIFTVRYEELVSHQESVSRDLLEHCGLPWEDGCLNFHKKHGRIATASHSQARKPVYSGSIGRWKHYEPHIQPLLKGLESLHE